MSLRKQEQRAVHWARQCAVVASAPGLLARIDGVAWRLPHEAVTAQWLLENVLSAPEGAERQTADDLLRLRRAVPVVANARRLEELAASGVPALKRWRGVDLASLLAEAEAYADRLAWATGERIEGLRPTGVLSSIPGDGSRLAWWRPGPLPSKVVDRDIVIADRLLDVGGDALARRWMVTARGRWWPGAECEKVLTSLARQVDRAQGAAERDRIAAEAGEALRAVLGSGVRDRLRRRAGTRGGLLAELGACFDELTRDDGDTARPWVLRLLLATQGRDVVVPAGSEVVSLRSVAQLLEAAETRWVEGVVDQVPDWLRRGIEPASWLTEQHAAVAVVAARHWLIPRPAAGWGRDGRALKAYLEQLDAAGPQDGVAGRWLRQPWVVELMTSPLAESALAMMAAAGRAEPGGEDAASALVAGLSQGNSRVRRQLRAWARPAANEIDVDALAQASGIDAAIVIAYVHYRRILGEAERLPRDAMRLIRAGEPVEEIAAVEQRLNAAALDPGQRSALERRLAALGDPAGQARRRDAQRRRVRNQMVRATKDYRVRALRAVLERAARERLPHLREGVPLSLLADLTWLASDGNVSASLLDRFIALALGAGSRYDWPENRRWIDEQGAVFDVGRWIAGFDETVWVADQRVRYFTEHDPVQAVHMGTWFGTCLALDRQGFNRFAALGNAVEANRHVVYATDQHGRVLARKLLAVSSSGELLGYRTYAFSEGDEHRRALDAICARFAQACGLALAIAGDPARILDERLWYDDGVEEWLDPARDNQSSLVLSRHLLSDEDVRAGRLGSEYRHLVWHGLWLDGRLSAEQRTRLVELEAKHSDEGLLVEEVALFDPDGLRDAALRARGAAGRMAFLALLPDRRLIDAVIRVVDDVDQQLLTLLPVERAIAYLRLTHRWLPSTLLVDTLRLRRMPSRRIGTAVNANVHRFLEWWFEYVRDDSKEFTDYMQQVRLASLGERRLRAQLLNREAAAPAAEELVRRGAWSCVAAVAAAVARSPSDERLALAGVAMGGRWPSGGPVSPTAGRGLVRAAVAAGLPAAALRGLPDSFLADVGHPVVPPADALRPRWEAARDLPRAVSRCQAGDWGPLRQLLADWPHLGQDGRIQRLIAASIVGPDEPLTACAVALAGAAADREEPGYYPPFGTVEVLNEAFARGVLSDEAARQVAAGAEALHRIEARGAAGLLAALSPRLPGAERLRVLSLADDHFAPAPPTLKWLLAREVRSQPALLDEAGALPAPSIANLVLGLTVGLPAPEAKPAILRLLRAIPADVRVAASGLLRGSERPDVFERQAQSTVTLSDHDHEHTPA